MWLTIDKKTVCLLATLVLFTGIATAETRTYYQIKDIAAKESGQVSQSTDKSNLFEYTFIIDWQNNTVTRTQVRRLDKTEAVPDGTVYAITAQKHEILGSEAGHGGKVLIAVSQDGKETLELGHRFAIITRISPFAQVITGVFKRDYEKDKRMRL